jgi:transposase InsO family protein
MLEVRRSTYYHHALRSPVKTLVQQQDEVLKPVISEIFEKSRSLFGARKIRAKLMELGHTISERRILRLMKELGISPRINYQLPNSANDREYKYYPNKLKRSFITEAPNLAWVSDITYVRVGCDAYYVCVIIELFSRKVIFYTVSMNNDASLVIDAFHEAFTLRGAPQGLIFHSDLGVQYTAYEFKNLLRHHKVRQSFSAPGSPHDNAVAESFFASIKKEEFKRHFYQTEAELLNAVREYVDFYNSYRPHQSLGFKTPDQIEAEYESQIIH